MPYLAYEAEVNAICAVSTHPHDDARLWPGGHKHKEISKGKQRLGDYTLQLQRLASP